MHDSMRYAKYAKYAKCAGYIKYAQDQPCLSGCILVLARKYVGAEMGVSVPLDHTDRIGKALPVRSFYAQSR